MGWDTRLTWRYVVEPCSFPTLRAFDRPQATETRLVARMRTPNVRVLTDRGAWQFARSFAGSLANLAGRATQCRSLAARCIALFLCAIVAFASNPATAAQITYVSVTGNWHDPTDNVPGSQPADPAHHEWRAHFDRPMGHDVRNAAKRLRLHHDHTAAGDLARDWSVVPARNIYASEFRGRRSFPDVGSARCRARAGRGRRLDGTVDLHLQVQPRGNPEQPESVSVSDTRRRRVYGPSDDRFLGATDDVPGRWDRLHVVDGFSGHERRSDIRIHHARRWHPQYVGTDRPIHVGADSAQSAAVACESANATDCDDRRTVQVPHHGAGDAAHRSAL